MIQIQRGSINPSAKQTIMQSELGENSTEKPKRKTIKIQGSSVKPADALAQTRNLKYTDEDGFMRGAKIAEKIQEFQYNATYTAMPGPGQPVVPIHDKTRHTNEGNGPASA
jgi:hypothetical protein